MITGAPLPSWRELGALLGDAADGSKAAAAWTLPTDKAVWFSRSAHSLEAIAASWQCRHGRLPRLWVPDYFCNASLGPVRRGGISLTFYPVGLDLAPDWEECRRLALAEAPDLFLAVHYFGLPMDMAAALEFCRHEGALLIEDCAHVLSPGPGLGESGTFVLWSPHKHLAVPQGGLVVCRDPDEGVAPSSGPSPAMRGWLIKRLVQKLAPGWLLPPATRQGPQHFADDPPEGVVSQTPSLAPQALALLAAVLPALPRVAARRRQNALALLEVLKRMPDWESLFDPGLVTPYRLVMRCRSPDIAAQRFDLYRSQGIPVESWPDLAPEVGAKPEYHARALALRWHLLCFPVHQGLDAAELTRRCAEAGKGKSA
ncbi:DegT/DnrJ/EryC1/StrS family aminotransferase [Paramagnetospirillum magneticum]|uniref:Pyridoxal phosphate-dependent enzyme n=1 Tax=Paramagnetospirillum magneticum (strain ATCC 700264 / AMB-1) TaxID=342108 RepID=Q2WBC6_PARM1|nr:DegT/DnrJ/EryC1/StrS family aminotransferase [Paramagnetospirillum magneticum]BAE48849.1 hypothetical protein amb0045 [Paramagnetospirillum magneticum AMB-1]